MLNYILDLQILNKYIHENLPPPPKKKWGPVHYFIMQNQLAANINGGKCTGNKPLFVCGILTEIASYDNILTH